MLKTKFSATGLEDNIDLSLGRKLGENNPVGDKESSSTSVGSALGSALTNGNELVIVEGD